jgi:hypothetical protein
VDVRQQPEPAIGANGGGRVVAFDPGSVGLEPGVTRQERIDLSIVLLILERACCINEKSARRGCRGCPIE